MNNSPWISNIPKEWKCEKAKYHFRYSKNKNIDSDVNLLSLTLNGVIENSLENPNGMLPSDISTYQKVKRNSLIFKLIDLENIKTSRVGICPKDGIMSSAYINLETSQNARYMYYQYFNMYNNLVFNKLGSGVRSTLNYTDLLNMDMLIPNEKEQDKIANFLDEKVAKIEKELLKTQELLSKTNDLYAANISNELSTFETKAKLKYLLRSPLQYGANESGVNYSEKLPRYIRITDISFDGTLKNTGMQSLETKAASNYLLKKNDILLARSGATVGKSFIFSENYNAAFAGYLIKATINEDVLIPKMFYYFTKSSMYKEWKDNILIKSTIENIGASKYSQLLVPIGPLDQQKQILNSLEEQEKAISALKDKYTKKISLLEEYKKVLINDAVTGKIKIGDEYAK